MESHDYYRRHHETIEAAIKAVCRKHRLPAQDAEEFAGEFRLRLLEEDCAPLRRFEGRSSLLTYLIVVGTREFLDWRLARFGKWRTSAEASRLGPTAILLERLTVRDGLSLDEAAEILSTNLHISVPRAELQALAARFPTRHRRRLVEGAELERYPAPGLDPDAAAGQREAAITARAASVDLQRALSRLPPQDRLILRMRFEDAFAIVDIARTLRLEPKPLYGRIDRLLSTLRRDLESHGWTTAALMEAITCGGFDQPDASGLELTEDSA